MEQIYWLLIVSTSALSILGTIIYFKWEDIKKLGCKKITFIFTKSKVRDQVYDVFKEMNPQYRRYIRSQVREYLKELQNEPTTKEKK
jgi:hypothetical protein|tara:strand:- start:1067 stop:1327 length:261 start_codon:yes stop_codon:yes gene_type:complete